MSQKVAVVTGANKGIGFAIVKALCQKFDGIVYLTSRDEARGKEAVTILKEAGLHSEYHQLDIADQSSVKKFRDYISDKYAGIDILVNNAGVVDADPFTPTYEEATKVIDTNYKSMFTLKEFIYPLIRNNGRIVNISSNCGHLSNIKNEYWIQRLSKKYLSEVDVDEFVDWYLNSVKNVSFNRGDFVDEGTISAYRVAKVALSAITMVYQRELDSRNICINSVHPGVVKTDMTHGRGSFTPDEAADAPVYLALEAPPTLKGSYVWYDRKVLDWYDHKADYYFRISVLMS